MYPIIPADIDTPRMVDDGSGPRALRAVAEPVELANGVRLPDPKVTPGSFFPDVTAKDICDPRYTLGIRRPRYSTKVEAFANYGVSIRERDDYQVDRLVPEALGGNNAMENLWPQPIVDLGATAKDRLERQLRGLVCSDKLTLSEAQKAITTNWWTAYGTYMHLPIDPGSDGPAPWTREEPVEGDIANGAPCTVEGQIGYTANKGGRVTCAANGLGELRWVKRA